MSAPLPVLQLDSRTYDRALSCVHCGLCLAACPTYLETRLESDSPRGRIQLIRGLADGAVEPTDSVRKHLDLCLDCRACETACPSGVVYHELIEAERINLAPKFPASFGERAFRWFCRHIVTHPTRLKLAILPARLLSLKRLPPGRLWPAAPTIPAAPASAKANVGLLSGCVTSALFGSVNQKTAELLAAAGATVISPSAQRCCGAIDYHAGSVPPARKMARRNIDAFLPDSGEGVDFIVSTAAGCGAMLRDYGHLLRDDPLYADRAARFAARVRDVTEVLLDLGLPEPRHPVAITATYHDACHLAHAQRVTAAPRALLAQVPGLVLKPLSQSDLCCGAAGTYFFTQPEMAGRLAARKLSNIAATGACVCIAANAGCALHLQAQALSRRQKLVILHPVDVLHAAVFGPPGLIEQAVGAAAAPQ